MLNGIADLLEVYPFPFEIRVLKASNGKMALELMAETTPDLIVSDIMMPEMDGYEFLQRVRQNQKWIHIPFIFLSARGNEGDVRKGRLSDADLYLTKPFAPNQLAALIQTQVGRKFEREQRRERALESMKKNMMQILNHEFRTPLTYVTAYYEMLETSMNGRNYREHLRGIQAGCVRLTLLVSDLIMLVDLRSGLMAAQFQQRACPIHQLQACIQAAINAKQALAADKRVEILFTPSPELPTLWGDAVALQNVLERLLDNAIKFSRPLPNQTRPVTISITTLNDEVCVAFRDEGIGIPPAKHERIFDLFEQHNRVLMEQQGFGMGLTIAKGLVELHNGRIEVTSEEGKGSTFTIVLPVYSERERRQQVQPGTLHGRTPATVLVVEDDDSLLHGLADLLMIHTGKYQVNVLTGLNGREGLAALQDHQPDLIISDIMMPQMDGYQFLAAVRENRHWSDIPFIFLTAKGEKRDQYEGYRLGVEEYITKPYDTDDLLLFVEKQLDKRFQSQQTVLQDFEKLKRSILNLVTPELMQPLTAVSIHTDKLSQGLEQTYSQEELSASLREIQTSGLRLNRLIEDLITLAELQTGETAVAYNYHADAIPNFGLLLFEMNQIFALPSSGTHIDCPFQEETAMVFGDSAMLLECVDRLLKFTVHYSQTVPEAVKLAAQNEGAEVHIALASAVPLQSEAFAHFETTMTSDDINLLELPDYVAGLHIVKHYVGLHNGRLLAHNTPQTGCHFTIALPIYNPE